MQRLDPDDLQIIGRDQTTAIFWKAAELYNNPGDAIGTLSFDAAAGPLASLVQYQRAEYTAGSIFESLEPGQVVQLMEGYFVLDDEDFPLS
ncbi:hypothetical protein [Gloeobacter morelensis]|uniref:Uncharacterized protein n=1 Tax=Gloeobacter morelensis MG652769 TaxID=2781736 RepID=A0ABY3PRD4_9CYAN|nr:hypothetical protein [Gloeobacter morelensis]UFP96257.1 hypothetical protein ISF26_08645 [Gloeobacter morelensis MG652769]